MENNNNIIIITIITAQTKYIYICVFGNLYMCIYIRGVWLYSRGEFVVRLVISVCGFKGGNVFFVLG